MNPSLWRFILFVVQLLLPILSMGTAEAVDQTLAVSEIMRLTSMSH